MTSRTRFSIVALLVLLLAWAGCGPPQLGADREAFKQVDALFTAVSLRDPGQLDRAESGLQSLRTAGKLPDAAADRLAAIVAEARAGRWEPAQEQLRAFMEGQRPAAP